ncbi:uncharacterized protein TNCV_947491 [Trichonephila clavipes]|nr:uncharacterized protein TNCV_947491 [Trichonephila clavipes]
MTLTVVPLDMGLNPGEDMDVRKCIMSFGHEGTINSHRGASPLMKLVEGADRWEALDHPYGTLPQNCGGTESNRTLTYMVLKASVNDKRKSKALCSNEFRGPRCVTVRQVALKQQ